jgi:hypothetical protein
LATFGLSFKNAKKVRKKRPYPINIFFVVAILNPSHLIKEAAMGKMEAKNFDTPDDVRTFDKGRLELVNIGGAMVGKATFLPGWKWSTCLKHIAKTKSCEAPHFQYHLSGVLKVVMDDGTQRELRAGDVSLLPPGHDAWVVGNEPVVVVDFQGMVDYAKECQG